jgi:hypothetical protein
MDEWAFQRPEVIIQSALFLDEFCSLALKLAIGDQFAIPHLRQNVEVSGAALEGLRQSQLTGRRIQQSARSLHVDTGKVDFGNSATCSEGLGSEGST